MHIDLEIQAEERGGVFTRAEAIAAGYTDADIKHLVRRRDWKRLRRGRFVSTTTWDAADEVAQLALRCHAAVATGRHSVLSHDTAARLHGLPLVATRHATSDEVDDRLHLTVPTPPGSRPRVGTRVHVAAVPPLHCTEVRGLALTSALRTAVDLARLHGEVTGVVAADCALNRGADPDELVSMIDSLAHWPGASATRRVAGLVDAGSESPGETLARLMVGSLGLGPVLTQSRIESEGRHATVDLRIGRLIIEFDGRSKYGEGRQFRRDTPPGDLLWSEKQREDWLRLLGYTVVRLTWADLWPPRRAGAIRMIRERFHLAHPTVA